MGEIKKYLIRFTVSFVLVLIISMFISFEKIVLILYKILLCTLGFSFAEFCWAVYYKPYFGSMESITENEKIAIGIFRGLLYSAFILAICWAL